MNSERSESAKALAKLISQLQAMGFTTDAEISIDAIDQVAEAVGEVVAKHVGHGDLHCKVIYSASEGGFWCNSQGWTRGTPTFFFGEVLALPIAADAQLLDWNDETKNLITVC